MYNTYNATARRARRWIGVILVFLLVSHAIAPAAAQEDVCEGPVVELQLEAQDGSLVATEYGVVAGFGALPSLNRTRPARLAAAAPLDACGPLVERLDGAVALAVRGGGCSFVDKYLNVAAAGGSALLVFNDKPGCVVMGGSINGSSSSDPSPPPAIPAISIDRELGLRVVNATARGGVSLISIALLDLPALDAGAALLWLMAVGTVAGGALWAGADAAAAIKGSGDGNGSGSSDADARQRQQQRRRRADASSDGALDVTPAGALAFVALASTMLLLLYFLMSRAVFYIVLGLFTLSGAQALGIALAAAAAAVAPALDARTAPIPGVGDVPLTVVLAAPAAAAVAAVWVVFRNAHWSWPLLDALGVALMLLVLRTLRLGGLKVACVLLPLCFAYDVFFVFVQPYLTGGDSVMVDVARGAGGAGEPLPMLLRVPRLSGPEIARGGYSMLGFGDIILPGLLAALARRLDVEAGRARRWPRGYFAPTLCGYGAGLGLTFVALACSWFGDQGQPALLYLVPCTLGAFLAAATARGELAMLWRADGSVDGGGGGDGGWQLLLPSGSGRGAEEERSANGGGGRGSSSGGYAASAAAAAAAAAATHNAAAAPAAASGQSGGSPMARLLPRNSSSSANMCGGPPV